MIFPSLPLYVDPPSSWTQLPQAHQQATATTSDDQQPLPPAGSTGSGPIRLVSMTERVRLAKIPQPEAALSCPRCHSNNTKFCYFNNYSLTQPRHFCKTCRRYWTRGGTLRNVPVGGGSRRRSKSSGKSSSLTTSTSPKLQLSESSAMSRLNLELLPAVPPLSLFGPAVPWSQLQEDGHAGQGFEQWRLAYLGGVEAAVTAAEMNRYHEGEWSVSGSINGNGGEGWMSNSGTGQVLGFGNSPSMGNGST